MTFVDTDDSAPNTPCDPLARSAAPVTSVVPRNLRRVTPCFSFESEYFSCMSLQRTSTEIPVNGTALFGSAQPPRARRIALYSDMNFLPLAHQNKERLLKIFAESYNAAFMSSQDNNFSALRAGMFKELRYFIRQFRRSVLGGL